MSALRFAKQAFSSDKPHSSITDWVDILTGSNYQEEAYDGIPEIVDAINLQTASGYDRRMFLYGDSWMALLILEHDYRPAEASRAIRKKLKHGNVHQQYRALVILKALVENCGQKFHNTFHDGQLTDVLKQIATDPNADKRVKKKLTLVLGSWKEQYKDDPSMSFIAGLYKQCRVGKTRTQVDDVDFMMGVTGNGTTADEKKRMREKEEKKKAKKRDKEERAKKERERDEEERRKKENAKRVPFEFEKDKPKVLQSIVDGSQASSNLVNAITLVNRNTDSLHTNQRVQECLEKAKKVRKLVVRYIQLVENEEVIGTLIETNDRLMAALEMYERLSASDVDPDPESTELAKAMANTKIAAPAGETLPSPFEDDDDGQRSPTSPTLIHPDLEDLNFGALGGTSNRLPAPLRPSRRSDEVNEEDEGDRRGSLSDFSDYESSDEETHKANAASATRRNYVTVSDDEDDHVPVASGSGNTKSLIDDDPFADPFADDVGRK